MTQRKSPLCRKGNDTHQALQLASLKKRRNEPKRVVGYRFGRNLAHDHPHARDGGGFCRRLARQSPLPAPAWSSALPVQVVLLKPGAGAGLWEGPHPRGDLSQGTLTPPRPQLQASAPSPHLQWPWVFWLSYSLSSHSPPFPNHFLVHFTLYKWKGKKKTSNPAPCTDSGKNPLCRREGDSPISASQPPERQRETHTITATAPSPRARLKSQNPRMVGVGRDLCGSPSPAPPGWTTGEEQLWWGSSCADLHPDCKAAHHSWPVLIFPTTYLPRAGRDLARAPF